jgi:hypothetical protein
MILHIWEWAWGYNPLTVEVTLRLPTVDVALRLGSELSPASATSLSLLTTTTLS